MAKHYDMQRALVAPHADKFVAARWNRQHANEFIEWIEASGEIRNRARTFGDAISRVADQSRHNLSAGELANKIPEVLRRCDELEFSNVAEAAAYAGLHLLDRYGRVLQVFEYLMQIGSLPLRKAGIHVLEVGAGPAPALYAACDFYSMLRCWPGRGEVEIGDIRLAHSLERGEAWDRVLHHLSEQLMLQRGGLLGTSGLPMSRSIYDFTGFDTAARHHESRMQQARSIREMFESADEYLSDEGAARISYGEKSAVPSAYDLIFMCNFLTRPDTAAHFQSELRKLAFSLTPGGVLVVLGGTGRQYPEIYQMIRGIAHRASLKEVSPSTPLDPNRWTHFALVRDYVRANVEMALSELDSNMRGAICAKMSRDLWDANARFTLPKYQVLAFASRRPPTKGRRRS